jgi:hypothetical protein
VGLWAIRDLTSWLRAASGPVVDINSENELARAVPNVGRLVLSDGGRDAGRSAAPYSTANPTASPKIEAARMISVKLIDMDYSSRLQETQEVRTCPITLGGQLKFCVLPQKKHGEKGRRLSFGDSRRPYQAYGNGQTVRHRTAGGTWPI